MANMQRARTKVYGMTEGRSRDQSVSAPGTYSQDKPWNVFRVTTLLSSQSSGNSKNGNYLDEMLDEMEMRRGGGGGGVSKCIPARG